MQGEREARVAPGRRVIVASADGEVRQRLAMSLRAMRHAAMRRRRFGSICLAELSS